MLVARTNPRVMSGPASTFSVTFAVEDFSEAAATGLEIRIPDSMHRAVPKRKAEYVAGRFCARQAMRALGADGDADLPTFPDRGPVWPAGIIGSITHTAGFASAAICRTHFARGIGIDSERIMSDTAMRSVRDAVLSPHDVLPRGTTDDAIWATLAFSAKESVFKCFYPQVKRMFWFETVRMQILDTERRTFRATLLVDLSHNLPSGTTVEGCYQIEPPFVHTGVLWNP